MLMPLYLVHKEKTDVAAGFRSMPHHDKHRPMPLTSDEWKAMVRTLQLTPQQARIVELLLRGMRDKQIAATLRLRIPTIRTHLRLVFQKLNVADRLELILLIFFHAQVSRQSNIKTPLHHK